MLEQCKLGSSDSVFSATNSRDSYQGLLTIKQFCKTFPWPSESAMRSYIYRADVLGLSSAFVRVGRRVLIIPHQFFSLIKQVENRLTKGESYEATSWRKGKKDAGAIQNKSLV